MQQLYLFNYYYIIIFFFFFLWGLCMGGSSHMAMVYNVPAFWGAFSTNFGIAINGFSSETKEPKLHKLGVFWANYRKNTQFGQN